VLKNIESLMLMNQVHLQNQLWMNLKWKY